MRSLVFLALVAALAGCAGRSVPAPEPPDHYEGTGPPELPPHAADAASPADRRHGGCVVDSAFAWPRAGATFALADDAHATAALASNWTRANVTVWFAANARDERPSVPTMNGSRLEFGVHETSAFAQAIEPGVYLPWSAGVNVTSDDPAVAALAPPPAHGWLLVTRGSDDKLWVWKDGVRLPEDPFPLTRMWDGDVFVSGRGVCP